MTTIPHTFPSPKETISSHITSSQSQHSLLTPSTSSPLTPHQTRNPQPVLAQPILIVRHATKPLISPPTPTATPTPHPPPHTSLIIPTQYSMLNAQCSSSHPESSIPTFPPAHTEYFYSYSVTRKQFHEEHDSGIHNSLLPGCTYARIQVSGLVITQMARI
ncbi:hypothetical protein OCU04_011320 [Sclerotinia nivalis]|uniref:Uncharacterized protein n=1 Tax=Sclerotinia nivalis TaxID=352851 RepID=A0A9X0DDN0_9HELO|nr:hypothetical protein OCU04_011320 [Sclerotinia nivalis]